MKTRQQKQTRGRATARADTGVRPTSAELAEELASLDDLDLAGLRAEWHRLYATQPPLRARRDLLILAIAWKLQEQVLGGLTVAQKRQLAGIATALRETGEIAGHPAIRLKPGVTLVREWRGETHTVRVHEDGFEWRGTHYRSLSSIAREITGTHWSGPRFFGLKRRPTPFAGKDKRDA